MLQFMRFVEVEAMSVLVVGHEGWRGAIGVGADGRGRGGGDCDGVVVVGGDMCRHAAVGCIGTRGGGAAAEKLTITQASTAANTGPHLPPPSPRPCC